MKIALIGTHGIGKTTAVLNLASELKKLGFNVGIVEEVARICPFPINEKTTLKSQEWMLYKHHLNELEKEAQYNIVISDRSILDVYCYYYRFFGKNELMENFVKEKIKGYNFLFKMPINKDYLKKDNFRSTDIIFQKEIDEIMYSFLKQFDISFCEFESLEKTISLIKDKINYNTKSHKFF